MSIEPRQSTAETTSLPAAIVASLKGLDSIRSIARMVDWRSLAAFFVPLAVYLRTLAPTIYNLDSAELTTAAYTGGLMRATGYPLYLSIGYLWSRLPLGDVGYRMNLFSAVCGALTILLAERILRHLKVGNWATFGALGLLASSVFFWGLSLVAEVYTLHTALMAGFILALLRWGERPEPRRIAWVGLLGGMGLAHHAAMALLGPAAALFMVTSHPRQLFSPRSILAALAGLLLGLSFYLYLPLRFLAGPAFNYAGTYDASLQFIPVNLTTLEGLWWLVSGQAFSGAMMAYSGLDLWREAQAFLVQLGRAFFAIGLGPGIFGAAVLLRRNWRQGLMLGLMFAFSAGFYINYRVMDKDTMYLPAYLIWALWVGIGTQELLDWMRQSTTDAKHRFAELVIKVSMIGFVLLAVAWNWRIVDMSADWTTRTRGEAILARAEAGGLVFGWWDTVPVVQYLQLVEGQRPDIKAVNRFLISGSDLEYVIKKEVSNRPIYIDSFPKSLATKLIARPMGPVYRLAGRSAVQPAATPGSNSGAPARWQR